MTILYATGGYLSMRCAAALALVHTRTGARRARCAPSKQRRPSSAAEVALRLGKAEKARVVKLLATLATLGQAGEDAGRCRAL